MAVTAAVFVSMTTSAAPPPPDPSCAQEPSLKSLNDNTPAVITFANNTSVTLQSIWLDFNGKRVFYRQVAAGTSYNQQTWLTHPWIAADLSGTCLKLHVTNSVQDIIEVSDATPLGAQPTAGTPTEIPGVASAAPQTSASANTNANAGSGLTGASGGGGGGFPTPAVIAGALVVAAGAGAGVALGTGWRPPLLRPGGGAPQAGPAGSPTGYDLHPTGPSTSPTGYDLHSTGPSTSPSGYGLQPTTPSQSPTGYGPGSTPPSTSPPGYDAGSTPPSTSPPGYDSTPGSSEG